MNQFNISQLQLSKYSGVGQAGISAILRGRSKTSDVATLLKLASGLEFINPFAKASFWYALQLPDHLFDAVKYAPDGTPRPPVETQVDVLEREKPEAIRFYFEFFLEEGLIDQDKLKEFDEWVQKWNPPMLDRYQWLSLRMQERRKRLEQISEDEKDENQR